MIALVGSVMLYALATRRNLGVNVLHDRNPLAVTMADGGVRNGYTVRLLNKQPNDRKIDLSVDGAPGSETGYRRRGNRSSVTVGPDQTLELRVLVSAPPGTVSGQGGPGHLHRPGRPGRSQSDQGQRLGSFLSGIKSRFSGQKPYCDDGIRL